VGNVDLGGFDVVVHLAESVINRGLELLPNGSTFPVRERKNITLTALGVPAPVGPARNVPLLYDAFLELDRPQVTLNQSTGRVTVHCNLSPASQLTFLKTAVPADAALLTAIIPQIALGGSIQLDCPFGVADLSAAWGQQIVAGRAAVAHAAGVAATITLAIPSADGAGNVPLATSAVNNTLTVSVSTAAIQTALESAFGSIFGNDIGDIPLTNPVRLNNGATPVQTVRDVVPRISPAGSPSAISLGVLTAISPPSAGGTVPAPGAQVGTALGAVLGVANYWTLHLVCNALTAAHPGMTFTITQNPPSASFRGSVIFDGGDEPIHVRRLDITVNPLGGLAITGHATASATCWDATIDFDFNFTFTCDPSTGTILAASSPPNVLIDTDKSIWCVILGAILGAIAGFIVGAIVGAFISGGNPLGAIIGGGVGLIGGIIAAEGLIDPLALDGVSLDQLNVLGGLTLPLPVGAAGFLAEVCDFDDFVTAGKLVYVDFAERHRSGTVQFSPGAGFDLDAGVVRLSLDGISDDAADLFWNGSLLGVLPGARIGPTFDWRSTAFDTLSLTDLEGFSYGTTPVSLTALAGRSRLGAKVTFAARTDEGRFAKCRARRDLAGRCELEYVVYARPPACLSTVITLDTLSQTVVEEGTDTCTEVHPVVPFNPFVDVRPVAPPATATATFLRAVDPESGRQDNLNVVRLLDLKDLFDRGAIVGGVFDPGRPPQRPPKPCGTHTTVENREIPWQMVDRRQQITLQALPIGLTPPITYEWTVFDTTLTGSGTMTIDSIDVTFDENSPILTLVADEGVDVAGSIVVVATDADGRHVRTTRHVNSPSRIRSGGCCHCASGKLTLADAAIQLEQARVARRVYDAGVARLQMIAATGQVKETPTVSIKTAVGRIKPKAAPGTPPRRPARTRARAAPRRSRR
jgi:hypothetical protein